MALRAVRDPAEARPASRAWSAGQRPCLVKLHPPARPPVDGAVRPSVGAAHFELVELDIDRTVVERVQALRPAVVLIDLDGGRFDVVRLCRSVRAVTDAWIMVISSATLHDAIVVATLDAGADDVVAHSSSAVIDARLRVGLRSRPMRIEQPATIFVGDVAIDLRAHEVRIDDVGVRCPPVQFELLVALARQTGAVVRSEDLLETIWGASGDGVNPRRLRIAVSAARNILGSSPTRPRLETVTKIGYRLMAPSGGQRGGERAHEQPVAVGGAYDGAPAFALHPVERQERGDGAADRPVELHPQH